MQFLTWKRSTRLIMSILGLVLRCAAIAQSTPQTATLRAGTPVTLSFTNKLSSANATVGEVITFTLASDVVVNGTVVAKSGTKDTARITAVTRAAAPGRSGSLSLHLESLHAGTVTIPLCASMGGSVRDDSAGCGMISTRMSCAVTASRRCWLMVSKRLKASDLYSLSGSRWA